MNSISPIDGRYRNSVDELAPIFSEYGLHRYRIMVEIDYFIFLAQLKEVTYLEFECTYENIEKLRSLYDPINFTLTECQKVKEYENQTNHDVKAVEYYIADKFREMGFEKAISYIHFGLTSQDINSCANMLQLIDFMDNIYYPEIEKIETELTRMSKEWKDIVMVCKTHGQTATPSTLGFQFRVFRERLHGQIQLLRNQSYHTKFGGATGGLNAHYYTYPNINWTSKLDTFVENNFGLTRYSYTTQINSYETMTSVFDNVKRINTLLIDLCQDIWLYVSYGYLKQKIVATEVGSSTMPHKVNPINFENAEGNLYMANGVLETMSRKLPISRLQRDLTDSTILRNLGVGFSHTIISIKSILKGFSKITPNKTIINRDINDNKIVLAEAIQTVLRKYNVKGAYELLKKHTRNCNNTAFEISTLVNKIIIELEETDIEKQILDQIRSDLSLERLTIENYTKLH
jgi:adenylosuccinate lyase